MMHERVFWLAYIIIHKHRITLEYDASAGSSDVKGCHGNQDCYPESSHGVVS